MEKGEPSAYVCPECNGALFRIREGKLDRFRCHTGHGFSTESLLAEFTDKVEAALWQALAKLQETAEFLRESAAKLECEGDSEGAAALARKAGGVEKRLDAVRAIAMDEGGLDKAEAD